MKNFYRGKLDVSPIFGCSIYECIEEAVKVAKTFDVVIKFRFNDTKFKIEPDSDLQTEFKEAARRLKLSTDKYLKTLADKFR